MDSEYSKIQVKAALKSIKNIIACDVYSARQLADDTAIVDCYEKTLTDIGQIIDEIIPR